MHVKLAIDLLASSRGGNRAWRKVFYLSWSILELLYFFFSIFLVKQRHCFAGTACVSISKCWAVHLRPGDGAVSDEVHICSHQHTTTNKFPDDSSLYAFLPSAYIYFSSFHFAGSCIFCRGGSQVWIQKRVGVREKVKQRRKKKSHLFPSSKGLFKMLTRWVDGNALYGCIIIWSALEMHLRWAL